MIVTLFRLCFVGTVDTGADTPSGFIGCYCGHGGNDSFYVLQSGLHCSLECGFAPSRCAPFALQLHVDRSINLTPRITIIIFYYHLSPNPAKVALLLEETGVECKVVPIDTRKGEQFEPAFLAINQNAKTPALVDDDAVLQEFAWHYTVFKKRLAIKNL